MKHLGRHPRKPTVTLSALAVAALIASGGALSAQTIFTVPTDICTWDWAAPATPGLLAELENQNLLVHTTVEMAKNCPEKLCEINWEGYAAPGSASHTDEMLCELSNRQLFFDDITGAMSATCPDVAQLMIDRSPAVGGLCGAWPRAAPGGTGGTAVVPTEEFIEEESDGGGSENQCIEESCVFPVIPPIPDA